MWIHISAETLSPHTHSGLALSLTLTSLQLPTKFGQSPLKTDCAATTSRCMLLGVVQTLPRLPHPVTLLHSPFSLSSSNLDTNLLCFRTPASLFFFLRVFDALAYAQLKNRATRLTILHSTFLEIASPSHSSHSPSRFFPHHRPPKESPTMLR